MFTGPVAASYVIERRTPAGDWTLVTAQPYAERDEALSGLRARKARKPLESFRVRGALPINQVGIRVTHDRAQRVETWCTDAEHRVGMTTGRTFAEEVGGGVRERIEVTWGCGHVRSPLSGLLRAAD